MSVNSKMTAIADQIRALLGLTGTMGLDEMATHLGTEQSNVTAALAAIADKGVTVPDGSTSDALAELIARIEAGGGGLALPTGWAMEYGIYVPASDVTSSADVCRLQHTFKWYTNKTGTRVTATFCTALDLPAGESGMLCGYCMISALKVLATSIRAVEADGTLVTQSIRTGFIGFSTNSTSNLLRIYGSTAYPVKAGVQYLWVVIGEIVT